MTISPWHMWGGLAKFTATTLTPAFTYTATGQLARVEYKRPESWHFMFYARIFGSTSNSPAILTVNFDVAPGVGRGSIAIPAFEQFKFNIPIGAGGPQFKWSGAVNGPVRDDTAVVPPPTPTPNVIGVITAQDLQVSYTASVVLTVPGNQVDAEIGCLLAPWHHARPDWEIHKFEGEELHGK